VVEVVPVVDFTLYLITDRSVTKLPLVEAVRRALEGGVRAVQLREKDLPVRELLSLAQELRALTREFGAKLFINDRVDVAVAVDADGVHLGSESMPPEAVRRIVGRKMLIGISTHSLDEAKAAESAGADFITFGPVFETPSKKAYGPPAGIAVMSAVKKQVRIPLFALGGVKTVNIPGVLAAGADCMAMISAVLAADDIRKAAEEMNRRIGETVKGKL
jgi:thiamine-phosphate pyrophosphorylase